MTGRILLLVSGFALAAVLASTAHAAPKLSVDCDAAKDNNIQAAVDAAAPGDTVFISGTCNQDVSIATDDITLSGNEAGVACDKVDPSGSSAVTINGTVTVEGVRANLEFLEVTGPGLGVDIRDRATSNLTCNDISNNQETGVRVMRSSHAELRDNLIEANGQRSIGAPFVWFDSGLLVIDQSYVRSDGNTYRDNQWAGVDVERGSTFRSGDFLRRDGGTGGQDPDETDVIIERGCDPDNPGDPVSRTGCYTTDQGPVAIEAFNGAIVDIRNAEVRGEMEITAGSSLRFENTVDITGHMRARAGSLVRLRDRDSLGDRQVRFIGALRCQDTSQTWFSNIGCDQICSAPGNLPDDCVPVAACFDGEDNDGDGDVDAESDTQCADINDNDESS